MPPSGPSGPVNYNYGSPTDPRNMPGDNSIRYADMVNSNLVSQYRAVSQSPYNMSQQMRHNVASQHRYSYGVQGGQWEVARAYQRQKELNDFSRRSTIANFATGTASAATGSAGAAALGLGGIAGFAAPLLAWEASSAILRPGFNRERNARMNIASSAMDFDRYSKRMGFSGGGLTYGQSSMLGRDVYNYSKSRKNRFGEKFFDSEEIQRINKIGMASGTLDARGGMGKGSMGQYKKNLKDLVDTTEEVVKMLGTTIEGGMSIIKELKTSGFSNMGEIKSQIRAAKSMGNMTGLGSQNYMALGRAGAMAVQGTPFTASSGATQYQQGAVTASMMMQGGGPGAAAVMRSGGVAQAGASIASTQMNIMSSGVGSKVAAYMMNSKGDLVGDKMSRLLSGRASAHEVSSGANATAHSMGTGRVRFDMMKEDMYNNMTATQRQQVVQGTFNTWRSGKRGSVADQAAAFSGQFTNNANDRRLFYENLMANKGYANMYGQNMMAEQMQRFDSMAGPKMKLGWLGGLPGNAMSAISGGITNFGAGVARFADATMYSAGKGGSGIIDKITQGIVGGLKGIGILGKTARLQSSGVSRGEYESQMSRYYGLTTGPYFDEGLKNIGDTSTPAGMKVGGMMTIEGKAILNRVRKISSSQAFFQGTGLNTYGSEIDEYIMGKGSIKDFISKGKRGGSELEASNIFEREIRRIEDVYGVESGKDAARYLRQDGRMQGVVRGAAINQLSKIKKRSTLYDAAFGGSGIDKRGYSKNISESLSNRDAGTGSGFYGYKMRSNDYKIQVAKLLGTTPTGLVAGLKMHNSGFGEGELEDLLVDAGMNVPLDASAFVGGDMDKYSSFGMLYKSNKSIADKGVAEKLKALTGRRVASSTRESVEGYFNLIKGVSSGKGGILTEAGIGKGKTDAFMSSLSRAMYGKDKNAWKTTVDKYGDLLALVTGTSGGLYDDVSSQAGFVKTTMTKTQIDVKSQNIDKAMAVLSNAIITKSGDKWKDVKFTDPSTGLNVDVKGQSDAVAKMDELNRLRGTSKDQSFSTVANDNAVNTNSRTLNYWNNRWQL